MSASVIVNILFVTSCCITKIKCVSMSHSYEMILMLDHRNHSLVYAYMLLDSCPHMPFKYIKASNNWDIVSLSVMHYVVVATE